MAGKVVSKERRDELLNKGKRRLEAYENIIREIERGTSEAEACRMYSVNVMTFRNFIRRDYEDTSEYIEKPHEEYFTWQDELCAEIFGNKTTACKGFTEAYEYVKIMLTDREAKVLDMRYKEGMNFVEIGKIFNVTSERVKQIEHLAIRKLRHPSCARILYYGLEYKKRIEECERKLESERNAELEQLINKKYGNHEVTHTVLDTSIDELDLSVRSYNCLKRADIRNLSDLVKFSNERGMDMCRNLGLKSFDEIVKKTEQYGIKLKYSID